MAAGRVPTVLNVVFEGSSALVIPSKPEVEHTAAVRARWSLARRVAFRFGIAYLVVATFPGPIDPLGLERRWDALWTAPIEVLAARLFGRPAGRLGSMTD